MPTIQGCVITRADSRFLPGNCPEVALVTTIAQLTASGTASIPIGATSWSLYVAGANATINGIAVATGASLSSVGLLDTAVALVTGTTTTITYTYTK